MHIDTILRRRIPAVLHARPESRCIQTRSKVWAVSLTAVLGPSHPGLMWSQQETPETTRELSVELSTHMPISRQHRLSSVLVHVRPGMARIMLSARERR